MSRDNKQVKHLHNGVYQYFDGTEYKYGSYDRLPDWVKVLRSIERQEELAENRQRRIKKRLLGDQDHRWYSKSISSPSSALDHSDRICLKYLESVQAGASCVQAKQGSHSRCAVNCYSVADWERHEREALG